VEVTLAAALSEGIEPPVGVHLNGARDHLTMSDDKPARAIVDIVKWIEQQGLEPADIHLKRPTLEDVFLELTGRSLRD